MTADFHAIANNDADAIALVGEHCTERRTANHVITDDTFREVNAPIRLDL